MLGEKKGGAAHSGVFGASGAMTLEQMKLDRSNHNFTGDDEYDPLNPTQAKRTDLSDMKLKG